MEGMGQVNLLVSSSSGKRSTHQLDNGMIECVEPWVLDLILWFPVPSMGCGEQQGIRIEVPARRHLLQ